LRRLSALCYLEHIWVLCQWIHWQSLRFAVERMALIRADILWPAMLHRMLRR